MSSFATAGKKALLDQLARRGLWAALYNSDARLGPDTRQYSEVNELANGNGYGAGGVPLTNVVTGYDNGTAWLSFDDPQWPNAAFMDAKQMLIYDLMDQTAYAVLDFERPLNGQGATFRVELPPANAYEAIIRI